jgi:hypothetical protein
VLTNAFLTNVTQKLTLIRRKSSSPSEILKTGHNHGSPEDENQNFLKSKEYPHSVLNLQENTNSFWRNISMPWSILPCFWTLSKEE